jgi:serine acetyltransferase
MPKGATIEDDVVIGGGCTIMPGITIGERSFIAAGAVVTKDIPPRSLVVGVPGRIEPLPASLDMPNNRRLTIQPVDLWHPETPDLSKVDWPKGV